MYVKRFENQPISFGDICFNTRNYVYDSILEPFLEKLRFL